MKLDDKVSEEVGEGGYHTRGNHRLWFYFLDPNGGGIVDEIIPVC